VECIGSIFTRQSSILSSPSERIGKAGRNFRGDAHGIYRATCIYEEFISGGIVGVTGLDSLQGYLVVVRDSANKKTQSVEGSILKTVDISCPASEEPDPLSAGKAIFQPTPVRAFYAEFPKAVDKVQILSHCCPVNTRIDSIG
jgi:hypothetical protein